MRQAQGMDTGDIRSESPESAIHKVPAHPVLWSQKDLDFIIYLGHIISPKYILIRNVEL